MSTGKLNTVNYNCTYDTVNLLNKDNNSVLYIYC